MLEIIVLIALTRKIGRICEDKGRNAGGYKALTVLLWFGGEIIGAVIGVSLDEKGIGVYIFALIGAAIGAAISAIIANSLEPIQTEKSLTNQIKENNENLKDKYIGDYKMIEGGTGEAFCIACRQTSPINGMFHHRKTDTYYHRNCLSTAGKT